MSDSPVQWSDLKVAPVNPVGLRRDLAAAAVDRRGYPF
jgi:hypothetical protein